MGILLLGIWMILFGLTLSAIVAISNTFLGIFAIVVGVVLIAENRGVVTTRL